MASQNRDPTLEGWMPPSWRWALGLYHIGLAILLGYLLIVIWPTQERDSSGTLPEAHVSPFGVHVELNPEIQLIVVVMIAAAIGSYAHAATSFATFVGNRQLERSWLSWYILRPFIGIALALTIYLLSRGGLLSVNAGPSDLNPFGIAGLSALAGMFSKQATDKLREVFDNLFHTQEPGERIGELRGGGG